MQRGRLRVVVQQLGPWRHRVRRLRRRLLRLKRKRLRENKKVILMLSSSSLAVATVILSGPFAQRKKSSWWTVDSAFAELLSVVINGVTILAAKK